MQRFVCEQNIAHFQRLLETAEDDKLRRTLLGLLSSAKRELALLNSQISGADLSPLGYRKPAGDIAAALARLRASFDASDHPCLLIDPGPGLKIFDINDAYARATFTTRDTVVGMSLFEIFPDNPAIVTADGVSNLYESLRTVVETGQPHALAVQRYDVRNADGVFVERYWQSISTPVQDLDGRLICLLHTIEDVTAEVLAD
ncbi:MULTISPECIES: PAS domain-containing protein [Rhodopseudomonas]|uniref:PAS fold-4 domain protein n=1 Tax=Rhodopseudomonas palustris (strain DX-1) TaxID=652103 RepID=E6VLM7_RHOPX|nr:MULTISPECIES: PAS domain-containing protein [Rhodopseudomonas]NEW87144.1 diguanylate cyclase [Rhodopseudomonas sp. WA056]QDL99412.1 diguanylate cyclase [Rhodopseudomonas palustris]